MKFRNVCIVLLFFGLINYKVSSVCLSFSFLFLYTTLYTCDRPCYLVLGGVYDEHTLLFLLVGLSEISRSRSSPVLSCMFWVVSRLFSVAHADVIWSQNSTTPKNHTFLFFSLSDVQFENHLHLLFACLSKNPLSEPLTKHRAIHTDNIFFMLNSDKFH